MAMDGKVVVVVGSNGGIVELPFLFSHSSR